MVNLPQGCHRILVSPTNGDLLDAIEARGVRVHHLPLFRRRGRIGAPLGRLTAITMLTSWIIRNRRGLVAIHANGFSELHLIALGAALSRVPVVAWFHGYQADPWDKRLGPVWRRLIANCSFVAVSELARDVVVATGLAMPNRSRSCRTRSILETFKRRTTPTSVDRSNVYQWSGIWARLSRDKDRSSPRHHRTDSRVPADLGTLPSQGQHPA